MDAALIDRDELTLAHDQSGGGHDPEVGRVGPALDALVAQVHADVLDVDRRPATVMVEDPRLAPVMRTGSLGLASEQVALQRTSLDGAGGSSHAVAGHVTVDVVCEPAIDSKVTSRGRFSPSPGAEHIVVVSVCSARGCQLTVAQRLSATIMAVRDGKPRLTPIRLRLSPPLVRYV